MVIGLKGTHDDQTLPPIISLDLCSSVAKLHLGVLRVSAVNLFSYNPAMAKSYPIVNESVRTHARNEIVDVTPRIGEVVKEKNVREGMVVAFVPHTTAAITINENADPDVKSDMLEKLSKLVPKHETYYQHGEGNSDSHVKTAMVGNSVTVLVENGKLVLGTWQGVYFCEFDGPRQRELLIKVVSFE